MDHAAIFLLWQINNAVSKRDVRGFFRVRPKSPVISLVRKRIRLNNNTPNLKTYDLVIQKQTDII